MRGGGRLNKYMQLSLRTCSTRGHAKARFDKDRNREQAWDFGPRLLIARKRLRSTAPPRAGAARRAQARDFR